ncbi:putative hydrolase [Humibacillus xanthopallidus]|uniref:Putative hydrolase n=1 Tax=Humibacillus xanthopallidus TaxID=412689 RepID=A0A543PS13_9MICO|nr:zinc-dependent metalloprotease [Humibacillus xanthopallidus]TQN46860.1 putative hydrolase [Humibacillus xanthopallidus]
MADDRGPDGNEGEQRPEDETGNEVGSGAGDGASTGTGDSTSDSAGDDSGLGSGEDVTRRNPMDSPFGLPLRGGSRDSGTDPFAGLSGLGGPGGFGGFGGAGGPGGFGGGDLGAMLEQVLGEAANNPELAEVMRSMGVDPTDPATQAAMRAQLGTFMQAQQTPTGSRDLATDVARKHVLASEGNDVHDPAAARAVADAVAVATLWLDEQTTLAAPAWRATGLSRAEWVEATMPRWFELIEPVSDGVTAATSDALRKQMGELGPEAFGEALPPGMPEGFDPRAMVEQWAPMLGNLSRQMFSAQLGQAVGTLATEVVGGTEVGLPLTEPGLVALLPGNVAALAESLEIDLPQVRLYLAVREAARVRLFSEVPWLGPQLLSAVDDYARNITIDTEAIESALTTIDASDPEALRGALQGNLFRPHPTPAQQAALARLETLLALAEGWVDHVSDRATASHLPQSAALAETIRRRRVGGAAQKTFAGLVGLDLSPRRLRDAANLWAALENAGGADLRDSRWAHPDLAPTAADLDDPIGYVQRATGGSGAAAGSIAGSEAAGVEGIEGSQASDLDAVLRGILEEADRAREAGGGSGGTGGDTHGPDDETPGADGPSTGERE